jgi:DNA-binding LytR/AlgR family response regulator
MAAFSDIVRVLAVEDDSLQARGLRLLFKRLPYDLLAVVPTAAEALRIFEAEQPDVVLLDIQLADDGDGIELAHRLNALRPVPLIFLTSFEDDATYERARAAGPFAFLQKPYDERQLVRAIELAILQFARLRPVNEPSAEPEELPEPGTGILLPDSLFLRENNRFVRIPYTEIDWLEADNAYCHLYTTERKYTARMTLREVENRLPPDQFIRIQRGYVVRLACIRTLEPQEGLLGLTDGRQLPLGRAYRADLLRRLNLIG